MEQLIKIKTKIYEFIGRYEIYVMAVIRFVIAFEAFRLINSATGYMDVLTAYPVAVILALICCFVPAGLMIFFGAVLILLQFYALSPMLCLVVGLLLLILFCVYLRFSERKGLYTVLTPILAHFGIPYVMPVASGFFDAPYTVVSVICGEAVYFIVKHAVALADTFSGASETDTAAILSQAVSEMVMDREMYLYLLGFAVTAIVVFCIRKLTVKYAHLIAVVIGTVVEMVFICVGEIRFLGNSQDISKIITGGIVSLLIMLVVCVMTRGLDYKKVERLQFEDDEYYYYVKAVPRTVARAGKIQIREGEQDAGTDDSVEDSSGEDAEGEQLAQTVLDEMQSMPGEGSAGETSGDAVEGK